MLADNLRAKEGDVITGIWKHEIMDADGNLGPQELVLDWSQTTGGYAESIPTYFMIGTDGTFYITTDNENPIKMFNIDTGLEDILYKDILTPPYDFIGWGSTDMFVVHGGEVLRCVRIGMGGPGAPYIGMTL
ncbi:hypothetical protein JW948_10380 [bacterium]|nr:hypothetical protein [bacterium]